MRALAVDAGFGIYLYSGAFSRRMADEVLAGCLCFAEADS